MKGHSDQELLSRIKMLFYKWDVGLGQKARTHRVSLSLK
jgi:hypothetical protein